MQVPIQQAYRPGVNKGAWTCRSGWGTALLLAAPGLLFLAAGCSSGSMAPPNIAPEAMSEQALAEYDTNKDGQVDGKELEKCPGLKSALKSMDSNGDGRLNAEEIATRLRYYVDARTGLISGISCQVLLDGRPLREAKVTFVPESFLASAIKPASGVTDTNGYVTFQTEGFDISGVQPGIYRVEVSLKDPSGQEKLPARYNTQTVLGQEVFDVRGEIVFRLTR
jgi:hypothetical protein